MPTDVETLLVKLEARITDYEKKMARAKTVANDSANAIQARFNGLNSFLGGFSKSFLAAFSIAAVATSARSAIGELGDLADAAERAGVSGEKLQIIGYALEKTTGSAEQATGALAKFNTTLGQAQVNDKSEQADAFRRLGVAVEEASGKARSTEAVLDDVLKRLASVSAPAQRAALAVSLFGKAAGPDMAAMLATGTRALDDARQHGVQYSNEVLDAADDLDNKLKDLGRTWDSVWKTAVVTVGESVTNQIAEMNKLSESLDDLVANPNWQTLKRFLVGGIDPHGPDKLLASVNDYIAKIPTRDISGALNVAAGADIALAPKTISEATSRYKELATSLKQQYAALTQSDREQAISNALLDLGADATAAQKNEIAGLEAKLYDASKAMEEANERARFFGETITESLSALIVHGESAKEVLSGLLQKLADAAIQAALLGDSPLASLFGTAPARSGGIGGLLGALFGGARAGGGDVEAGKAYLVGEKRPELFVPKVPGTIVPRVGGGSSFVYSPVIDARGADSAAVARLADVIAADKRNFHQNVIAAVNKGRSAWELRA